MALPQERESFTIGEMKPWNPLSQADLQSLRDHYHRPLQTAASEAMKVFMEGQEKKYWNKYTATKDALRGRMFAQRRIGGVKIPITEE